MNETKPIGVDEGGSEPLKLAIVTLLNQYPDLNGRVVSFQGLGEDSGISIEPESGTLVYTETEDILGNVRQECQYPFFVVYRSGASSEYQKMTINEFLDSLGSWLGKETISVDGAEYQLTAYPEISGGRKIKRIVRFNSYALEPNENRTQDWVLPVTVEYTHEYQKVVTPRKG